MGTSLCRRSPMRISYSHAAQLGIAVEADAAPPQTRRPDPKAANDLVSACLHLLALQGVRAWRNNTTGVYDPQRKRFRTFTGRKGISDILGIIPPTGRLLAVECKSGK